MSADIVGDLRRVEAERDALRAQVERVRALADDLHDEGQAYTPDTSTAIVARLILRSTVRRLRQATAD